MESVGMLCIGNQALMNALEVHSMVESARFIPRISANHTPQSTSGTAARITHQSSAVRVVLAHVAHRAMARRRCGHFGVL